MGPSDEYAPCRPCSHSCLRVHGNRRTSSNVLFPCFFKQVADYAVHMAQYSCWIQLPSAFVKTYLPNVKRQAMILEGRSGLEWPVTYTAQGFHHGWRKFSADHELMNGDVIFFTLMGNDRFVVQVFSKSGCEKVSAYKVATNTGNYLKHQHHAAGSLRNPKFGKNPIAVETPSSSKKTKKDISSVKGLNTSTWKALQSNLSRFREDEFQSPTKKKRSSRKRFPNGQEELRRSVFTGQDAPSDDSEDSGGEGVKELLFQSLKRGKRKLEGVAFETGRHIDKKRSKSVPPGSTTVTPILPTTGLAYAECADSDNAEHREVHTTFKERCDQLRQQQAPMWRHTQSQILARAVIERAKLRKTKPRGIEYNRRPKYRGLHRSPDSQKSADTPESSDEHEECSDGTEASSFDGEPESPDRPNEDGSSSQESGYGNSSESDEDDREEDARAGLRSLLHSTKAGKALYSSHKGSNNMEPADPVMENIGVYNMKERPGRPREGEDGKYLFGGTPKRHYTMTKRREKRPNWLSRIKRRSSLSNGQQSRKHQVTLRQDSPDIPAFGMPRKRGRPKKNHFVTGPEGSPRDKDSLKVEKETQEVGQPGKMRRRGRPRKHVAGGGHESRGGRDIFVSQRRAVTKAEKDDALTAAYASAASMKTVNVVVLMRPSFVYRNFVLGIQKRFAFKNLPDRNMDVRVCDSAWKAWFCTWNSKYCYLSGRGWRNFALEHCLEADDACVFEVIEHTERLLTLMVHIFRVAAIPDGVTGWQSHKCPATCLLEENSGVLIEPIDRSSLHVPSSLRHKQSGINKHGMKEAKREIVEEDSETTETAIQIDDQVVRKPRMSRSASAVDNISATLQAHSPDSKKCVERNQQGSYQHQESVSINGKQRTYYNIVRLHDRKKVLKDNVFLVELEGTVTPTVKTKDYDQNSDGHWWVHESHFTPDFLRCYID